MNAMGAPPKPSRPALDPAALAPYFLLAALIHLGAVATRFDTLAAKLPDVVAPAVMIVQFPLLLLSGYFESRLDYGEGLAELPLWMRIKSRPVKLAITFGMIFICLIPLQTWNVSIGPLDPTPPTTFPEQTRAMWFGIFTVGMFFPFYLAATGLLIPILRVITTPLRALPPIVAVILALVVGTALGMLIVAAASNTALGAFIADIRDRYRANPALGIAISLGLMALPAVIGLIRGRRDE